MVIFMALVLFSSCQDEDRKDIMQQPEAEKVPDSIQTLEGEFIFIADAAVIRGEDFVYEVAIDSMAHELAEMVQHHKTEDFDMVPVTVRGKIGPNMKREGWDEQVEIREIISVAENPEEIEEE